MSLPVRRWLRPFVGPPAARDARDGTAPIRHGAAHAAFSLEFFRDLFENANDVIYTADLSGVITAINHAGEELTGYTRDELVGLNLARLVAPESLGDAMRMMDPEVAGDAPSAYELEIVTKDDRRLTIEVRSRFLHQDGQPTGIHGIARDVTGRGRTLNETERRALRTEALHHIIAAADAAPDLPKLLELSLDRTLAVFGERAGGIWAGEHRVVRGLPPELGPEIVGALRGDGWTAARPHMVEDREHGLHGSSTAPLWRRRGMRASLVVPIALPEGRTGALILASPRSRPWPADDVAFAVEVGRQITATVEGLRLLHETRQRSQLMERLVVLNQVLHRSMSVAGVAAEIGAAALRLTGADRSAVYLGWPGEATTCAWSYGLSAECVARALAPEWTEAWRERIGRVETARIELPDGRYAAVAGPLLVPDTGALPDDDVARQFAEPEGFRAIAAWPLTYEDRVIAFLCCYYDAAHAWSGPEREVFQTFAWQAAAALENARLFESQRDLHHNLEQSYMQIAHALARAMDARDAYTAGHSERLAEWAERVARRLGCGAEEIVDVRHAARLHDIGKIGIPDGILLKPGPLTVDEWRAMQRHPVIGELILLPLEQMRRVATIVRQHHERWDGSGYPDNLRGDAIGLPARILGVVDSYCAIVDRRPYKSARSHDEAVAELTRCAGTKFDPAVVAAFCEAFDGGRPGAAGRPAPVQHTA